MGKEWLAPINAEVRAAINQVRGDRALTGTPYLFPAVNDPSRPLRVEVASAWLIETEKLAGVPKHDGSLWHAYRRKWATERKHLPDVDVAAAGGWSDTSTLRKVYQQADMETMQRVVSEPRVLREA
jgi:integrase